jgi:hypothetical protein
VNEYERWSVVAWYLAAINMKLDMVLARQQEIDSRPPPQPPEEDAGEREQRVQQQQ